MTVTDVRQDPEALALTLTSTFAATPDRVWQVWADPRLLERWWGPPLYPATFVEHDLTPGARVTYFMTSPEDERYWGYWDVEAVETGRRIEVTDGFALDGGVPNPDLPTSRMIVTLEEGPEGGTVMTIRSQFATAEAMAATLEMGAEEGMTLALNQIDDLLTEVPPPPD